MASPRVLLADDAPEILEKVKQLLGKDFDIVGLARNGADALEARCKLDPDLLVLDISMPFLNGIQVASRLRDRGSRAKVIFVTVRDDRDYVEGAFAAGARGYVLKSRMATDLIPTVRDVLRGHIFASPFEREAAKA